MLCAPNRQRHRKALYAPAGFRDAETHTEISLVLRADPITFRAQAASAARFTLRKQLAARFVAWLSEECSLLPSFRLNLDKLTKPLEAVTQTHRHFDLIIRR
jgi:hypothetical protein